jgi:hypothetical protein
MTHETATRLEAALASIVGPVAALDWGGPRATPIAIGWATVDLDRAALEIAEALGVEDGFTQAAPDVLLGATCRIGRRVHPGSLAVVLLEPFTEGRLAATLARYGEGPAAAWLHVPTVGRDAVVRLVREAGLHASRPGDGPFGPEILVRGGPVGRSARGPHLLLASPPAGTIDR